MSFWTSIRDTITAPLKVVGSALGIDSNDGTEAAQRDYEVSLQSAKDQMAFQQYNSDTSYQRAVKDLREAGLNPIMAALSGGASTPTGASYSSNFVGGKQVDISKDQLQLQRFQNGLATAQSLANIDSTYASTENTRANTNLARAQAEYVGSQNAYTLENINNLKATFDNIVKTGKLTDAQINEVNARISAMQGQISSAGTQSDFINSLGSVGRYLLGGAQAWSNPVSALSGLIRSFG